MFNRSILFWLAAAILGLIAPSFASAQVYKCSSPNGGHEYTDKPCSGSGASIEKQLTAAELAVERNARDRQAIVSMLRGMRIEEAKSYAVAHKQEALYKSILTALIREQTVAEQRRDQEKALARQQQERAVLDKISQLSAENESISHELATQRRHVAESERRAQDAQDAARRARDEAQRARQEAQAPKFDPNSGQWCQKIGGMLQCH